jgi:hypothetical protein
MTTEHLPSMDRIAAITKLETPEDAIMMAQDEIACLDDKSLEGDIPNNVLDIREAWEKALFIGS